MVHALEECWRVLVPGGQLVDMRPRVSRPDVELVLDDTVVVAGQIDDSGAKTDYKAADRAMEAVVARRLFASQGERRFTFAYYWGTPDQMQSYIDETWGEYGLLPSPVAQRARMLSPAGRPVRYRVREAIVVAAYRKRPTARPARGTE